MLPDINDAGGGVMPPASPAPSVPSPRGGPGAEAVPLTSDEEDVREAGQGASPAESDNERQQLLVGVGGGGEGQAEWYGGGDGSARL